VKKHLYIIVVLMISIMGGFFTQCGPGKEEKGEEPPKNVEDTAGDPGYRSLQISPQMVKQWNIRCAAPASREYVEKITLPGVVKENQNATFMIAAPVGGMVTAVKKDIGDPVQKGDTLCILKSPALLEIKTRYVKAFQDYRQKQENYERAKNLAQIKALEPKELMSRETEYKTAMAEYFSLEAELEAAGIDPQTLQAVKTAIQQDDTEKTRTFLTPWYSIFSPTAGKVLTRDLNLGEQVENSKILFEVSDTRELWVWLDAGEKDLAYLEKQDPVVVVSDLYPGERFPGRVLVLMEKIDPGLRTVKVRVEVENPGGRLKPGMYVKGLIEKQVKGSHLVVPAGALVKLSGVDGVFVAAGDAFLFKPLEVLETGTDGYAFVKGLDPNDKVVVAGAFYLKSEYALQGEEGE
jgi:cobalt-zinc-cadmium efflux system membrane fusion protein